VSAAVCAAAFFSFRSASRRSASSSARSADASASAVLQTTLTFAECCGAAAHFRTSHSAGLRPRVCLERLGRAQQRLLRSFGGSQVTPVGTRLFVPLELCDACCALASLVCRCALRCRRRLVTACLCAPLLQQSECPRWLLTLRGPARSLLPNYRRSEVLEPTALGGHAHMRWLWPNRSFLPTALGSASACVSLRA
jgi:hypothetical protein